MPPLRRYFFAAVWTLFSITHAWSQQVDPTNPEAIYRYLSEQKYFGAPVLSLLEHQSCQSALKMARDHLPPMPNGTRHPITCKTINDVWRLHSGDEYDWLGCIPTAATLGKPDHIGQCLTSYAKRNPGLDRPDSCAAVFDGYDRGLAAAIDPSAWLGYKVTTLKRNSELTRTRDGMELTIRALGPHEGVQYLMNYGGRDCTKAATVIRALGGSVDWLACTGFDPANVAGHVQQCLGPSLAGLRDCPAIRSAYESRLSAANGGSLPASYSILTCDQIKPVLDARAQADANARAAAAEQKPQAPLRPARKSSSLLGMVLSFFLIIALLAGGYYAFRAIRRALRPKTIPRVSDSRVYLEEVPSDNEQRQLIEQINARFDNAVSTAVAQVHATIKDEIDLGGSNGGSGWTKVEFQVSAAISQPLGSMQRADREVLRVITLLDAFENEEISKSLEFPRTGIVWGDGKAQVDSIAYTSVFKRYIAAKGLASQSDFAQLAIRHLGLSTAVAKGRLVEIIETLQATSWKEEPLFIEALSRLRGGNAWATQQDLTGAFDPSAANSLFIGVQDGTETPVRYSGEGSIITVAAPGSGKTQCNVIPNLLEYDGPAIVLDVKGELFDATAKWRKENVGPVFRFAPLDPKNSASYNPLDLVRSHPDYLWEDSRFLASMMIVPKSKNDTYWEQRAQDFLTAAIASVCQHHEGGVNRTMARVIDFTHKRDLDLMLSRLLTSGIPALERAGTSWEALATANDTRQFDSFLSTTQAALSSWEGARVEKVIRKSDWHPFDLRKAPYPTIYICLKPGEIDVYASLLRVFVAQHIRTLVSELPPRDVKPILFMLDELPRLKAMPPIEEALEIGRQYGIKLWMFAQSLGQMKQAYPNADGMIGSCAVRLYMNASIHDGTAERVSKELGSFESPLDGSQQKIAEPQELAGPRYKDLQLVLPAGGKPIRARKQFAYATEPYKTRMAKGE